jgi:hypothetical protein
MTKNLSYMLDSIFYNESPLKESKHSFEKCMECDKPPTYEVLWAEGMGHAWFCAECFTEWADKDEIQGDICAVKRVQDGKASSDWKDNKSSDLWKNGIIVEESINEDGEAAVSPADTTQANVNYLPAMVGEPQRPLAGKKKKKKARKVEESFSDAQENMKEAWIEEIGGNLQPSIYGDETSLYKFWLLSDGAYIPVAVTHEESAYVAGTDNDALLDSGAIAGSIEINHHVLSLGYESENGPEEVTQEQMNVLKKFVVKYSIKKLYLSDHEGGDMEIKSPDYLEYLLKYGDEGIEEKKMDESILEALQTDMSNVRKELKPALINLYNTSDFKELDKSVNLWRSRFGAVSYLTKSRDMRSSLVTYETKTRDIQKLYGDVLRAYKDDKGYLDMVLEAIQERKPLNTFDVFDKKDFLYATRIKSNYNGVVMIFEATIDMTYAPAETVLVEDDEVLGVIEEQVLSVKVAGKVIYPNGSRFTPSMLKSIKDAIDDFENKDFGVQNEEQ